MNQPQPLDDTVDEVISSERFRKGLADFLDSVKHGGRKLLVRNERRNIDMAVVLSPTEWDRLGRSAREDEGLSTHRSPVGGFLSRDQLARDLQAQSERLGGETFQLTAGEMQAIRGLLAELGGRYTDEPLGQLAEEWSNRLGKRIAPTG